MKRFGLHVYKGSTNDEDLSRLRKRENLEMLAQRVFDAFVEYKKSYDESILLMVNG